MILSAFLFALRSVRRNTLRAGLTVLSILIGIVSVVAIGALGTGAKAQVSEQINNLGTNIVIVFPQAANASGARAGQGTGVRLTEDDGRAITRESTSVRLGAPSLQTGVQAVFEGHNVATSAVGTTRAYFTIRAWNTNKGEIWEENSETIKEKVCVIGSTVQDNLFGSLDPVGRTIRIGRYPYRIIGVLETKGQAPIGGDQDDVILMPLGTYRSHVSPSAPGAVGMLLLSATSAETTDRAVQQVTEILRQRHRITENKEPDFVVRSQAEFLAAQQAIFDALSMLLLAVAAISLIVGGIGVMNIMLVSVTERTREIGIRMAVGAREADILIQFLVEAVVLTLLGGVLGLAISFALVLGLHYLLSIPLRIEPGALGAALTTSMVIGVVFGFFPARRAARLEPIHALHRE